ncbi:MAG: DUF445 domain-containing protein [Bacteriovoracaceae bacterium]|jgi:uncharacterized membrane protein YheB (UPF0754 family)|nr:DUF445 domain-containing protein [Bacteriovoracaceae bacterium]
MNKSLITNIVSIIIIAIGYTTPVFSTQIKAMGLYSFSGAITNWLAIHMLFEKVPFLYGSGIITNRFEEFKGGIKDLVMNQFFTSENIQKFTSGAASANIDFDNIFVKVKEAVMESQFGSMLTMFGGEAALEPLRPKIEEKFHEILSSSTNSFGSADLKAQVDLIVDQRLDELTPQMVKDIIQQMIKEHLGWLVVWGGVFGALIGLISTFI